MADTLCTVVGMVEFGICGGGRMPRCRNCYSDPTGKDKGSYTEKACALSEPRSGLKKESTEQLMMCTVHECAKHALLY